MAWHSVQVTYACYNQATLCDVSGAQPSLESTRSASHVSNIATSSWVSLPEAEPDAESH